MSSLAGALDPVQQELKDEPVLDDIDMIGQGIVDLFGEADENVEEVKHSETAAATPASSEHAENMDGISSPERRHREAMEYAEEEEEEQPPEQILLEATAAIPNIPVPRSSDGNYWVIRMPNFVKVDSKPFHPDTYIGPEGEDEDAQAAESAREKSMTIKLKVENTVRWRWVKDENGQDRRQSNARIVRWSDGTLSLLLGKELFDITQNVDTSGAMHRNAFGSGTQSQPLSQSQSQGTPGPSRSQGLTYLVAQHKRAEILQSEALVTGYMSLRPTGMQSSTHRMLVRAVGQKHTKVARLRMAPDPVMDPEREKMELMKAASRKPRRPRGEGDEGFGGRKRRSGYTRRKTGDEMWSDEEEEEEAAYGGGSEDEYGEEPSSARKRRKGEKEDAKKGPGEYLTDDFSAPKKRTKRKQKERGTTKRTHWRGLRSRLKTKREDSMDVESEEEDEGGAVRKRTAGGSRKKRVIEMEEEEEE
ncbi:Leo1-like protein-domain-containing protein [Fomitopsis serialis]|uniref:Leo1-like protein-domain-containing protein n=1 Tax=Fomitopsis serialis TaxID=139415 RepID=UPI00200732F8|nr:Leo1-like protein-domain-containing protein [Neoantrodia serialis]KAH9915727.1 Leo1-like protein-domain-containing protein [Neoantrodia serialis]